MTKTHWRMPDGPSPLLSDSRETHLVRSAKVILASGTVRQVGMICWRISHWYWCRVLGLRSARDSSHASAYSPKAIRPRAGPEARPDKRAANLSERTRHMREYGCNSGISLARVGTRAIEIGTHVWTGEGTRVDSSEMSRDGRAGTSPGRRGRRKG